MSYEEETKPLITHPAVPERERRPGWSRLHFCLALGLCFLLLTGCWHGFRRCPVNPSHFTADDSVVTGTFVSAGRHIVVVRQSHTVVLGVCHPKRDLL